MCLFESSTLTAADGKDAAEKNHDSGRRLWDVSYDLNSVDDGNITVGRGDCRGGDDLEEVIGHPGELDVVSERSAGAIDIVRPENGAEGRAKFAQGLGDCPRAVISNIRECAGSNSVMRGVEAVKSEWMI